MAAGAPEQGVVLLQKVHAELLQHPHIRHGQGHLAVGIVDGEVGGGAFPLQDQEVGDVDAGGHALPADLLAVDIVPGDGDHLDAGPQAGGILADVVGDAAHRHADEARVGVLHHQGFPAAAHEVDVHRADAHHIALRGLGEDVALAQDVALLGKIRDVDRHGGAGDARLLRQLLLGDAGILPDPVQDLLFPLGHGQNPLSENKQVLNSNLSLTMPIIAGIPALSRGKIPPDAKRERRSASFPFFAVFPGFMAGAGSGGHPPRGPRSR